MHTCDRTTLKVKRPLLGRNHPSLELRFVRDGDVDHARKTQCVSPEQLRRPCLHYGEDGSQGGVPVGEKLERRAHRPYVDGGADPDREGDVVGRALGRDLMDQPQRLLTVGEEAASLSPDGLVIMACSSSSPPGSSFRPWRVDGHQTAFRRAPDRGRARE